MVFEELLDSINAIQVARLTLSRQQKGYRIPLPGVSRETDLIKGYLRIEPKFLVVDRMPTKAQWEKESASLEPLLDTLFGTWPEYESHAQAHVLPQTVFTINDGSTVLARPDKCFDLPIKLLPSHGANSQGCFLVVLADPKFGYRFICKALPSGYTQKVPERASDLEGLKSTLLSGLVGADTQLSVLGNPTSLHSELRKRIELHEPYPHQFARRNTQKAWVEREVVSLVIDRELDDRLGVSALPHASMRGPTIRESSNSIEELFKQCPSLAYMALNTLSALSSRKKINIPPAFYASLNNALKQYRDTIEWETLQASPLVKTDALQPLRLFLNVHYPEKLAELSTEVVPARAKSNEELVAIVRAASREFTLSISPSSSLSVTPPIQPLSFSPGITTPLFKKTL